MHSAFALKDKQELRAPLDYGVTDVRAIEFSQREEDGDLNDRTVATQHGAFDNDEATSRSVLGNVLGVAAVGVGGRRFLTSEDLARTLDRADAATRRPCCVAP